MTTSLTIPDTTPAATLFDQAKWQQINTLLRSLDSRQALWLSGYLAAGSGASEQAPAAPASTHNICIAYGSETGNSEALAKRLGEQLSARGQHARVVSLGDIKRRELSKYHYLFVVCATHGDGDPPEPAVEFFAALEGKGAPDLSHTHYGVLALGDSSYEHFCTAGRQLDACFEQLGGKRLLNCSECDVDFAEPANKWLDEVQALVPAAETAAPIAQASLAATPAAQDISRHNPLAVEVLENIRLSSPEREKAIHHLELLCEPGKLAPQPGDALGVLPQNSPQQVAAILSSSGLSGESPVVYNEQAMALVEALREHLDLNIPAPALLTLWANASASDKLLQLLAADKKSQRQYLKNTSVLTILNLAKARVSAQEFVDALRPLQPRLYDLANYVTADDDELQLVVKDFRYQINNQQQQGVASRFLRLLEPGETVRLYVHANKRFRLPEEQQAPIILIGQGTGIAPYRAFLQHLSQRQSKPPCWLIFQEIHFEDDFLYQVDVKAAKERGALQKVDTLFTGDTPDKTLADVLAERAETLMAWLNDGAHIYICGEKRVLGDCEAGLKSLCEQTGNAELWTALNKQKRLHRNLY